MRTVAARQGVADLMAKAEALAGGVPLHELDPITVTIFPPLALRRPLKEDP